MSLRRSAQLPVLYQSESAECGIACLAMIASFHGHHLDLNDARHRFPISLAGTSLKTIVGFARKIGFSARALRAEPEHLPNIRCPAILHVDMNHFVVLKEMRGRDAIIHDPAIGPRRLSAAQIASRFTGIVLELTPGTSFEQIAPSPNPKLRTLVGPLPVATGVWAQALLLSVILQILVLASPFYVQLIVDRGVSQADGNALYPIAIGFTLLLTLRLAVAFVRSRVMLALSGYLDASLVANIVRHMLRLPSHWFASRHVSVLLTRLHSTEPIRDLVAEGLIVAIVDGAMAVLTITIVFLFAPALALIVLGGFACAALLKWWQIKTSMPREHEYIEALAKAQQEFIETVRGITTVKLFRKEADREARWMDAHVQSVNARYGLNQVRANFDIVRDGVQTFVVIAVVFVGAGQVLAGSITLGGLMAFIAYQQSFSIAAASFLDFAGRFRLLDVHMQRLADVVQSEPESVEHAAGRSGTLQGAIAVERLSFRYAADEAPILHDVSFAVAAGDFVAITGASGGGKTTLLKLLLGLLKPDSGRILFDGHDLRQSGIANMRDQVGVVMQDDLLLSGSLAQNITFFDLQPDTEWMRHCARMAAVDEDIGRLPMGYETLVGDMGTVLSGGQRQRVLLARALYRRPKILFMDEGTSSLDAERERQVNANLQGLPMTRLIIAHRAETIGSANRVLRLSSTGICEAREFERRIIECSQ